MSTEEGNGLVRRTARRRDAPDAAPYLVSPKILRAGVAAAAIFVALMLTARALVPRIRGLALSGVAVEGVDALARLAPGEVLEAPEAGAALLLGVRYARLSLAPGTRVRLDAVGRDAVRLELERGSLRGHDQDAAKELAITIPEGATFHLTGSFELGRDDEGSSLLTVEHGDARVRAAGRAVRAPSGYAVRVRPGREPDVPLPLGASAELAFVVERVGRVPAADRNDVAAVGRIEDRIVLLHLAVAPDPAVRAAARGALVARGGVPLAVDPTDVIADDEAWRAWRGARTGANGR